MVREVGYATERESWNEYLVEDGNRLKLRIMLTQLIDTGKKQPDGNPIYELRWQVSYSVIPPVKEEKNAESR